MPVEPVERFEQQRGRLHAIALHLLGSHWDAEDVVQDAWVRVQRVDANTLDNLDAWLSTVVSRLALDVLRRRSRHREELSEEDLEDPTAPPASDPGSIIERTDAIGSAMLIVLERLTPAERLALVLHDVFDIPFSQIADVAGSSPAAMRQLAVRARRRLDRSDPRALQRKDAATVDAFLRAARSGDFGALLQLLDPDIELRADEAAVRLATASAGSGAPLLASRVDGADAVARVFAGRAADTAAAWVSGTIGAVYPREGAVVAVYQIRTFAGLVRNVDVVAGPDRLPALHVLREP